MKKYFVFILSSLFVISVTAQNNTYKNRALKVDGIYILPGLQFNMSQQGTLTDFRQLAPTSDHLQQDFSEYSERKYHGFSSDGNASIMLALKFREKSKEGYNINPLLRVGVNYSSSSVLSQQLENTSRQRFDTLVSSQTGQQSFVDSVYSDTYIMDYNSEQIRLNASLIFRTNPEARWSVYAGIGLSAGVSINSYTSTYNSKSTWLETTYPYGASSEREYNTTGNGHYKKHKNKASFGFSAYIPLGIDLRLGNKSEFWKRTHLFFEFNPALQINTIPELYTTTHVSLNQGLGLRFTF